jgi:FtsP/CotA-like multicopper oxidase with cupredoxin domain
MTDRNSRRTFLGQAAAVGAGFVGLSAAQMACGQENQKSQPPESNEPQITPAEAETTDGGFSRYNPGFAELGSDADRGKMVPGRIAPGGEPVSVTAPDLTTLPYKLVDGVKEFHLYAQKVRREFLPGAWMDLWGYNGSLPGPTIEAFQGDRVRIVVHNELPEPTTVHWHGLELPVQFDGVFGVTQDGIMPGKSYAYEFTLHQTGTFFYHPHIPMQEAFGMVGLFIIHPRTAWNPVCDRDFALIFQNFHIDPNQTVPDSMAMDWSWHTINGRSGPYTTPLIVRHGERVRVRLLDFSPMQHHPIHLHGHTFWHTGTEGGRIPPSAWVPRNNILTGVAMVQEFEFLANNPGDWVMHCHMTHHMMNHMVRQVGPRIRDQSSVEPYLANLDSRPAVAAPHTDRGFQTLGYPQKMQGMHMSPEGMKKLKGRREVQGMRENWHMGVHGLMTVVRVLPDDLYELVMNTDQQLEPGLSVPGNPHQAMPGHHSP